MLTFTAVRARSQPHLLRCVGRYRGPQVDIKAKLTVAHLNRKLVLSAGLRLACPAACSPSPKQEVDYEAELILSTLMESHAGPAAAEAAAAAVHGGAAAGAAANGVGIHTPGGGGVETPMADSAGHTSGRSGGRSGQAGELGLSPAPGLTGRHFPGATVARPQSAGAAGEQRVWGWAGMVGVTWRRLWCHGTLLPLGDNGVDG